MINIQYKERAELFYETQLRTNCSFLKKTFGQKNKELSFSKYIPRSFDKTINKYSLENNFIGQQKIAVVGWGINVMHHGSNEPEIKNYKNLHPIERLLRTYIHLKTTEFSTWKQTWPLDSLTMPICPFEVPSVGIITGLYSACDNKITEIKKLPS
ncbi:MAG: hypothetical protein PVJ67_02770 [Candidatus Pacearchaeota archaeon]|jgi:hypothetical protein